MNLLEQLTKWLKPEPKTTEKPRQIVLKELMTIARIAQYTEQYDEANQIFDRAYTLSKELHDITNQIDIDLHRVDILILQNRFDEALALLQTIKASGEQRSHRAPIAYAHDAMGTLEQRRGNFKEAMEHYTEAERIAREAAATGAQGRATGHQAGLHLLENNASYALHRLRDALSMLQSTGDTELLPHFLALMAKALEQLGQPRESLRILETAHETAEVLQHRRYQREINVQIGDLALKSGWNPVAIKHYQAALSAFPKNTPVNADNASIILNLSRAYSRESMHAEALEYADNALTAARQLKDARLEAIANGIRAIETYRTGHSDEALPIIEASLADIYNHGAVSLWASLKSTMALIYAQNQQYDSAVQMASEVAETTAKTDLKDDQARALSTLGDIHLQYRRYSEAIKAWQRAITLWDDIGKSTVAAVDLCKVALARRANGEGQRHLREIEQALERLDTNMDEDQRGFVLHYAGKAYANQGEIETAEAFYREAIELAQKVGDKVTEATRQGEYGLFLAQIGDPKPALSIIGQARTTASTLNNPILEVQLIDSQAIVYHAFKRYAEALKLLDEALAKASEQPELKAPLLADQGDTYCLLEQFTEARPLYQQAIEQAVITQDTETLAQANAGMGAIALAEDDLSSAEQYLKTAERQARWIYERRLIARIAILQSQLAARLNKPKDAQVYWQEAETLLRILRLPPVQPNWL